MFMHVVEHPYGEYMRLRPFMTYSVGFDRMIIMATIDEKARIWISVWSSLIVQLFAVNVLMRGKSFNRRSSQLIKR